MRLWEFNCVGTIVLSFFDINKNRFQFVSAMLGFLTMNNKQLGYNSSIISISDGKSYIEIQRDKYCECLIFEKLIKRSVYIAGRATICWKVCRERDKTNSVFIIKDLWQYPEREEKKKLLQKITEKKIVNVARYYYYKTVRVNREIDNIRNNIRKKLDVMQSMNFWSIQYKLSSAASSTVKIERTDYFTSTIGQKRLSSQVNAILPPKKYFCLSSLSKSVYNINIQDRIYCRIIVKDYSLSIYRASSRVSLLHIFENCIESINFVYVL